MNGADALAALADIELPAPPDWRPLIGLAAALLVAALALILYIWSRRRRGAALRPRPPVPAPSPGEGGDLSRAALARLERLRLEWASGAVDARMAAYRLGTLLRLGLELPQLLPAAPPAALNPGEWRETLALLRELRYAPNPRQTLTDETFARAQRWLAARPDGEPRRDV